MKLYILPIILTSDRDKGVSYLLTQKNKKFLTPLVDIHYPEFFHKEATQHIVNFFEPEQIKINEECKYNYLGIQEEMSLNYVKKNFPFVEKEDIIVTYGGILLKYETLEDFQWTPMTNKSQHGGFSPDLNFNLLLSRVIQKSII